VARRMVHGPSRHDVAVSGMSYIHPVMHRVGWDDDYAMVTPCGQNVQGERRWVVGLPNNFALWIPECRRCFPRPANGRSERDV
jgi:hypothetical protein